MSHFVFQGWSYFLPALPESVLFLGFLCLMLLSVFYKQRRLVFQKRRAHVEKNPLPSVNRDDNYQSVWPVQYALILLLVVMGFLFGRPYAREIAFSSHFINDSFTLFIKVFLSLTSVVMLFNVQTHVTFFKVRPFEFSFLLLTALLGMFVWVSANDFMSMYLGLEVQSLSMYVLIGLFQGEEHSSESVIKYFILGAIASGLLLFGISLLYGYTGTTNFFTLEDVFGHGVEPSLGLYVGVAFLIAGMCFKVSAVPFHVWAPDVYQGTAYPLLLFLMTTSKLAALGFFARLLVGPLYNLIHIWRPFLLVVAGASIIVGALGACIQKDVRRLLAYASINSVGFSLIGLVMANEMGIKAAFFYTALSMIGMLGLITCILSLLRRGIYIESLDHLKGLASQYPFSALSIAVFLLTMSGLPPFPGFFGKLTLFQAVIDQEYYAFAILMALFTVVSAFYYLRVIKIMFFDENKKAVGHVISASLSSHHYTVIASATVLLLGLTVMPQYLFKWISYSVSFLFYA